MTDLSAVLAGIQSETDTVTFRLSMVISILFVVLVTVLSGTVTPLVSLATDLVLTQFGLGYQLVVLLAVGFMGILCLSPWGRITLGGPDADPEFGALTYATMSFVAGIAAGIVFWGPAEAIYHFGAVPRTVNAPPGSQQAAVGAIQYTLFHWGLSAWSVYLALGIPIAFFVYNRGAPLRASAVLTPFFGPDGLDRYRAKAVDVLAVIATIGGMTSTLGFVSAQFLSGIEYQWGVVLGDGAVGIFMTAMAVVFIISAVTGVSRGIRRLSWLTVGGFVILGLATLVVGPTGYVLSTGVTATTGYVTDFVMMSTTTGGWATNWTVFYWSWWFSWAPFVGLFIARISRGRTIRQVVLLGVGGNSLATMAWFLTMCGTAIGLQRSGSADILTAVSSSGVAVSGFPLFSELVFGNTLLLLFLGLVITLLVTSADSSTLSLAILTTSGEQSPSKPVRAVWGCVQVALAAVLLIGSGGAVLRSAAVLTGGPFALLAVVAVLGMLFGSTAVQRHLR